MKLKALALAIPLLLSGCLDAIYPPDPGEEGKKGILGVDSDSDGVRDDVERAVVDGHRDNPSLIAPLFHYAALKQVAFKNYVNGTPPPENYLSEVLRIRGCISRLAPGKASSHIDSMANVVTNTEERWIAQLRIDKAAAGGKLITPTTVSEADCADLEIPPLAPGETAEDVQREIDQLQ